MIRVNVEPIELIVDQPNDLTLRLTNVGSGACTNVVFRLSLPAPFLLLEGRDRIELRRLDANRSSTHVVRLIPKSVGRWTLASSNFSFLDANGHPRRITDIGIEVTVAPGPPAPVIPEAQLEVSLITAEIPFNEWELLRGRVVNTGGRFCGSSVMNTVAGAESVLPSLAT